jgi:phosphoglycolate phosphatase
MRNSLIQYKHIIWDWNGTLLDDASIVADVMNIMLKKRNISAITYEYYREIFDFPIINNYIRLGFDFSTESFESVTQEFIIECEKVQGNYSLHSNAEKILKRIQNAGISQSILSAAHQESLEYFTRYFQIENYFVRLIGLDNYMAASKIENGRKWISSLPHSRNEVLLIGDTTHDYEVSREIGCDCILVASGHQKEEKLLSCKVNIYKSLDDLYNDLYESIVA